MKTTNHEKNTCHCTVCVSRRAKSDADTANEFRYNRNLATPIQHIPKQEIEWIIRYMLENFGPFKKFNHTQTQYYIALTKQYGAFASIQASKLQEEIFNGTFKKQPDITDPVCHVINLDNMDYSILENQDITKADLAPIPGLISGLSEEELKELEEVNQAKKEYFLFQINNLRDKHFDNTTESGGTKKKNKMSMTPKTDKN